jgi:hypothetical protein
VCLVEDERIARRKELGDAFIAQHHVGKEKMVVDHHHVGGERIAPRLHDEALAIVGTRLPEAVVARRGGVRPRRRILGHIGEIGAVAGARGDGELLDASQVPRFLARGRSRCCRAAQPVETDVIGASFQKRHARPAGEGASHRRKIAVEKLVLQRLRAGGDDDFAAGDERGDEVSDGLARPRARFGDQDAGALDRLVDRLRHLELLRAAAIARDGRGKRPLGRKHLVKGAHRP